ncbi:hypothetical protein [Natronorubrum sulfidifaciens]|uniref:DUF3784 domain-containing protein n=1 Tax=Natronorubrum sulfidifaciens JCM 14089 TaxID=1230460 RepID=L9W1J7_9EURY|nr:hypothetical protein [Natronorubrum sulfidifaciens]ELY43364.1 hypothetical protein C495_13301 [Natronorubrum sulfidifaciens JCM 14089]
MVDANIISGTVWLLCGLAILYLGYLIAIRGRADLHANYDESVDPAYVSRWAGGTALFMGLLVVAYAIREMIYGFQPYALGGLLVALLVLSYLTKLFARGVGYRGEYDG